MFAGAEKVAPLAGLMMLTVGGWLVGAGRVPRRYP
jgi:hypothetical protein